MLVGSVVEVGRVAVGDVLRLLGAVLQRCAAAAVALVPEPPKRKEGGCQRRLSWCVSQQT
jgi:hypothetical protein